MDDKARQFCGRVGGVYVLLLSFFEEDDALAWLDNPQPLLDGRVPTDLLHSDEGAAEVRAVVERLRDGAYI